MCAKPLSSRRLSGLSGEVAGVAGDRRRAYLMRTLRGAWGEEMVLAAARAWKARRVAPSARRRDMRQHRRNLAQPDGGAASRGDVLAVDVSVVVMATNDIGAFMSSLRRAIEAYIDDIYACPSARRRHFTTALRLKSDRHLCDIDVRAKLLRARNAL